MCASVVGCHGTRCSTLLFKIYSIHREDKVSDNLVKFYYYFNDGEFYISTLTKQVMLSKSCPSVQRVSEWDGKQLVLNGTAFPQAQSLCTRLNVFAQDYLMHHLQPFLEWEFLLNVIPQFQMDKLSTGQLPCGYKEFLLKIIQKLQLVQITAV